MESPLRMPLKLSLKYVHLKLQLSKLATNKNRLRQKTVFCLLFAFVVFFYFCYSTTNMGPVSAANSSIDVEFYEEFDSAPLHADV